MLNFTGRSYRVLPTLHGVDSIASFEHSQITRQPHTDVSQSTKMSRVFVWTDNRKTFTPKFDGNRLSPPNVFNEPPFCV